MSFDIDKDVDLDRARPIVLGGRTLQVAPMTLRKIMQAADMLAGVTTVTAETPASTMLDRLIDFVLLGLSRAYPALTREDLLESETTAAELQSAVNVIVEQAGGQKKDAAAGEQVATSDPSPGARSSPSSSLN